MRISLPQALAGSTRSSGLALRVAGINLVVLALVIGALLLLMNRFVQDVIGSQVETGLQAQTQVLRQMVESADKDLRSRAQALSSAFQSGLRAPALGGNRVDVAGKSTPELRASGQTVNSNTALVDEFTASTGAVATVFARDGDDFVRVTTSLKIENGARAMGTVLARDHPAYAGVKQGQPYVGLATLFGKRYMTSYTPLKDAQGQVVGIAFIGLDLTQSLVSFTSAVRSLKIGQSGYFFVLDTRQGKTQGQLVVHPAKEGQSILEAKTPDGRSFISEMIAAKQGITRYLWINAEKGETGAREKIVAFDSYEPLGWMIAGGTYLDEFEADLARLRYVLAAVGSAVALLLGAGLWLMLQCLVSRPLVELGQAAQRLAAGDLSVSLQPRRNDEVGELARSINQIGAGLADLVRTVRSDADSLAVASAQVAQGNGDLAQRTEQQAAALQQTSAAMSQLGGTVAANTQHSTKANTLARDASEVAQRGGTVVSQVVQTMHGIDASSHRIADIISVIDGIAFQTNILALNAAVEAARAGESGRGFAVVAAEVRSLAGRAAAAAREIRGLIDASVEQVSQGGALVDQAGSTMQAVVASIEQVCEEMARISEATAQQSQGIMDAGAAVSSMDQATQQNAVLVEQVAASTEALRRQADDLVQAVSIFKLPPAKLEA